MTAGLLVRKHLCPSIATWIFQNKRFCLCWDLVNAILQGNTGKKMKDNIWERCYPLPLTYRGIVSVISRRTGKLRWCFTLISDPVISVANLSVFPLTVISLEVTFRWTIGLVWVISTVRTEITHFVDIDAVSSICTPDKQMKANSDSTAVQGLKFGEKDNRCVTKYLTWRED